MATISHRSCAISSQAAAPISSANEFFFATDWSVDYSLSASILARTHLDREKGDVAGSKSENRAFECCVSQGNYSLPRLPAFVHGADAVQIISCFQERIAGTPLLASTRV